MKIGRNDPCPCGSGKKFKKCCLGKAAPPVDLLWRRLGEAHDRLAKALMNYAEERIHPAAVVLGMNDFLGWPDIADMEVLFGLMENHEELFWPWFFYNWEHDAMADGEFDGLAEHVPIARMYADAHSDRMDSLQRRLLEGTIEASFSFWEVIGTTPGQGMHLKDLLTGSDTDVMERLASESLKAGDILLCRVVRIDHVAMMMGCSQVAIPPPYKRDILFLKTRIEDSGDGIDEELLWDFEDEIFECYHDIYRALMGPPEITNAEGDAISFHLLHYDIDDPHAAAEKLVTLAAGVDATTVLKDADRDANGRIVQIGLPWFRNLPGEPDIWGPLIFARMDIEDNQLVVTVNSKARAEIARAEIDRRLGEGARHRHTEVHTLADVLDGDDDDADPLSLSGLSPEALLEDPDLGAEIAYVLADHWRRWMDMPLPVLQRQTPRQAVDTPEGREIVARLLADAEALMQDDPVMRVMERNPIDTVRRRLGLEISPDVASFRENGREAASSAVIRGLLVDFCGRFLTYEATTRVFKLCDRLELGTEFFLNRGRPEIWAAAIIYAIAQVNFLFETEDPLDVTREDIHAFFGTKPGTVSSKARQIRDTLGIDIGHADYCTPDIVEAFTFDETPEGFILPRKPIPDERAEGRPLFRRRPETGGSGKQQSRRDVDDKQLRLFDD